MLRQPQVRRPRGPPSVGDAFDASLKMWNDFRSHTLDLGKSLWQGTRPISQRAVSDDWQIVDLPKPSSKPPSGPLASSQTPEKLLLCRFSPSGFIKELVLFAEAKYVAFSHVWGEADIIDMDGIGRIKVSQSKANFMRSKLQDIVGESYFWMDILCISQAEEDEDERINLTAIFPEIYRRAQKTVVIRDGLGFHTCCAEVIGQLPTWAAYDEGVNRWYEHWRKEHQYGGFHEGILERLWPLQEISLSRNIQFVSCDESTSAERIGLDFHRGCSLAMTHIDRLWSLSRTWATFGTDSTGRGDQQLAFVYALLNNGAVARPADAQTHFSSPLGPEFALHNNSTRHTSKSRDFILAVMPLYDWYSPPAPKQARQDKFGSLFLDFFEQARHANRSVMPRITKGMVGDLNERLFETDNIPTPVTLGDFVKLYSLSTDLAPQREKDCCLGVDYGIVHLRRVDSYDMSRTISILKSSMSFSRSNWILASRGELSEFGFWPEVPAHDQDEKFCWRNALAFLNLMVLGFFTGGGAAMDGESFERDFIEANPPEYNDILIRLGALISCGIGISAFQWSESVLAPVLVRIKDHEVLGLISSSKLTGNIFGEHGHLHCVEPLSSTLRTTYKNIDLALPPSGAGASDFLCVGMLPNFHGDFDEQGTAKSRLIELGLGNGAALNIVRLI